jgi:HK97 gp10 family phage protein
MIRARVDVDLRPLLALKGRRTRLAVKIGIQRAAKPVRAEVTANAERIKWRGFIAKSIGTRVKQYRDAVTVIIGPKTKVKRSIRRRRKGEAARFVFPSRYAPLVEKGTKRSRKKPFLEPALDSTQDEYMRTCAAEIEAEIRKTLAANGG